MQRAISVQEMKYGVDQGFPFVVLELPQAQARSHMTFFIGVAAGAAERTLLGDLNRKGWPVSGQGLAPCSNHVLPVHCHCVLLRRCRSFQERASRSQRD